MEKETHVVKDSTQKNLALDPDKQKEFKKNNKKIKAKKVPEKKESGVVYLGHLPHGFYEKQIKQYMTQFGKVKAVKVSRSIKTGKSKGYAFVEFYSDEVAKVVADTMDNYLVFERIVKCQYVPTAKLHPKMMGRRSGVFKPPKAHILARDRHNNKHKELKQEKTIKRLLKKHKKRSDMLKSLGIDLQMNKLENVITAGKKILKEKAEEREKAAKLKSDSEVKSSAEKPPAVKKSPKSAIKSKSAGSKSADTPGKNKTPKALKATPVSMKKANTPKGTPATKKATEATPKPTNVTTPAKSKSATPVHKVTPMVQKKKKTLSESFNSSRDQSMEVLIEDSEEEEISFKTPPHSVRSSKTPTLTASTKKKRAMSAKENNLTPVGRPQKKRKSVT